LSILVDPPSQNTSPVAAKDPDSALVSWVMSRVDRWRTARDSAWQGKWDEYYRLWRGRWSSTDKNRGSERSKIITPALAQAIEMTVAEMEEATFGREQWLGISDNDAENTDVLTARDQFLQDFAAANAQDGVTSCFLHGALYGTAIAKLVVEPTSEKSVGPNGELVETPRALVRVEAIEPAEFIPDPAGRTIDEMLGCAHEVRKPRHFVTDMQTRGIYRATDGLGSSPRSDASGADRADLELPVMDTDSVLITEYHGLVPARLLPSGRAKTEADKMLQALDTGDGPLVEAIVTIINGAALARGIANPFTMNDRSIVAYQHERVPNRFWGRGVAEKGYNPQKALDAEVRARIDAMALTSNPMMGADLTRLPRGFDLRVRPGKVWGVNGSPGEILSPIVFSGLDPNSFNQSGELERMVQMGTGAMDTATPTKQNARNETATGTSLMVGAFIKRSKRAMANVSRNFIEPLVQKMMWRYMQFEPQRYPKDYQFRVIATSGIMAREFEQNQMTQLMGQIPDTMPATKATLTKSIVSMGSYAVQRELEAAIQQDMQPNPEAQQVQQMMQQMQLQAAQLDLLSKSLQNSLAEAEVLLTYAKVKTESVKGDLADDDATMKAVDLTLKNRSNDILMQQNQIAAAKVAQAERHKVVDSVIALKKIDATAAMKAAQTKPKGN
jgi:hypothetical protein